MRAPVTDDHKIRRPSHHAERMDYVAPSATRGDALEGSRGRRRSVSIDSNNKRTRLEPEKNVHDVPLHQAQYASSYSQPPSSAASAAPAASVASYSMGFSATSSNGAGPMTLRHPDQHSQHFTSSILNPPQPRSLAFEALSSSRESQTHPASFPSPPLASPTAGSPFHQRESAYSNDNQRPSSPSVASSSSSSKSDNIRPPYPPIRPYEPNSSSISSSLHHTPSHTFGTASQQQQSVSSAKGFAAPFPPAHRPYSLQDASLGNGGSYNMSCLPYVADGHTSISLAAAQNAANAMHSSYAGPEPPLPNSTEAVYRIFRQDSTHTSYSQTQTELPSGTFSPAFGGWVRPQPNHPKAPSTAPSPHLPAAPLRRILHPVDQSPKSRNREIPMWQKSDNRATPQTASSTPRHEPPSAPPSTAPCTVSNGSPTFSRSSTTTRAPIAPRNGNEIQIVPPASAEEAARSQQRRERRWRSNFTVDQRNETSQTRAIGACLRCKSQRVRCVPSPHGPFHTCLTCEQVSKNSKKVLHEIRCVRWRMIAMITYRNGGLNLTRRWDGTTVQDVGDWTEIKTYEIEMKLFYTSHMHRYDLCDIPIKFRVRGFRPIEGDVLTRKWIKKIKLADGTIVIEKRYIQLPPYALADANATVEIFRDYFEKNAIDAMLNVAKFSHPIIRKHLEAAVEHFQSLPDGDVEKIFMQKFIKLWFCVRFTTGTDYISGPQKLGCLPVPDPDYPLGERISVPRMITAQGDSIMVSRFLRPLTQDLIPEFEKIFRIGNPDNWFMLYVCTFILLSEISFSCQDRRRHAQENWLKQKYTLPEFVGELQFGANIILCYWHYYRTMDPMDDGWDIFCKIVDPPTKPRSEIESAKGKGKKKVHLTRSQHALVTSHWRTMVEIANMMDTPEYRECFEHPLYFVCQMYMKGWQIRDHYKRGPPEEPEETI